MAKRISLKRSNKPTAIESPRESYPSFTIYDHAPQSLLDVPMDTVLIARIKKTSEEKRSGTDGRKSVGFDVLSVEMPQKSKAAEDRIFGDS